MSLRLGQGGLRQQPLKRALGYDNKDAGPPVVLVHGGLGDLRMWDGVVPLLAVSHRVVRFDVRGFGRTETAVGKFSPHEDIRAMLDALGIESAALVGLSLGGRIVLDAALELPERVSALVLVAPGVNGLPLEGVYTEEQDREFDEALARAATSSAPPPSISPSGPRLAPTSESRRSCSTTCARTRGS